MLTDNYQPFVIEVNTSPTLEHSTEVSTRLTEQMCSELISVVIDTEMGAKRKKRIGGWTLICADMPVMKNQISIKIEGSKMNVPKLKKRRDIL
ncbi:Tubulin-tyrosine ligase/Tubulin polyglutamylase like protein [Aduncisulcus paluster]|uniref:Tubulin-tyrosine ligase/Tubulin polyglutamylase like protein n=1 Tax=Aduncisulcus paluster TaxID=2918883 RepID=A0ABQ5KRN0_9EUKA|nr:Tubulin-tyrosine ligase/Tubulin polyglutamylase like protein [Aduncisulcus paluster]